MSLLDHARAARFLAIGAESAAADADPAVAPLLLGMAAGYRHAADQIEAAVRAEAQASAEAARCTLDHRRLTVPKCPACGASRG